mmetsp:Transcript_7037/g.22216  ORF Transcript_7037/g.22216 Transcript_7037/m.22216 type:complete len:89 (+) Transcript_7037:2866-3132(+)
MDMKHPSARQFTWGLWGLNHCFISLLKLMAIYNSDKPMLKLLTYVTIPTFGYCVLGQKQMAKAGGDVGGFVAICGVQILCLGYLGFLC